MEFRLTFGRKRAGGESVLNCSITFLRERLTQPSARCRRKFNIDWDVMAVGIGVDSFTAAFHIGKKKIVVDEDTGEEKEVESDSNRLSRLNLKGKGKKWIVEAEKRKVETMRSKFSKNKPLHLKERSQSHTTRSLSPPPVGYR